MSSEPPASSPKKKKSKKKKEKAEAEQAAADAALVAEPELDASDPAQLGGTDARTDPVASVQPKRRQRAVPLHHHG